MSSLQAALHRGLRGTHWLPPYLCTTRVPLKAVDTIGNCQRLAFTVGVSQHMHKITNNERKNHTCHTKLCAFRWFAKSNSWKIASFSKTMALQRERFLTLFYTSNVSPLLVTKIGFMLIIILSNYQ